MKKVILAIALLLALVGRAEGQSITTVSATVVDSAGSVYIQGSYTASLVNNTGQTPLFGGNTNFQKTYQGGLDSNGIFSVALPSVTVMFPLGMQWSFYVCANPLVVAYSFPKPALPCFTYVTTGTQVSGTSVDLSASMTAVAAIIPKVPSTSSGSAFTGANTFKNINRVRMIDFANLSGWAGADACAWINSAISDIGGNQGLVDARGLAGGTSTCTSGTVTVPQNITLLLGGTILTNANPGFSATAGASFGTTAGGIIGMGRSNTLIQCTTISANCLSIGGSEVAQRGFTVSDLRIIADAGGGNGGNTIQIQDFAIQVAFQRLQLGPILSCVVFVGGTSGYQFEDFQDVRCDGFSGVGFNANLSAAAVGGTNLQLTNVYMNGGASATIGFDIEKWLAVTINSSDNDNAPLGWKLVGVGSVGAFTLNSPHCEVNTTGCISIAGVGSYTITTPSSVTDGYLIDVSAVSDVSIYDPSSSGTSGGNDIIFEAGASGGNYLVEGGPARLSKPTILAGGTTTYNQINGARSIFAGAAGTPGLATFSAATNGFYDLGTGLGVGYVRGGNPKFAFDAGGTLDQFDINGAAGGLAFCPSGLFGNSCDSFFRRTASGAVTFGNGPATANGQLTLGTIFPGTVGSSDIGSTSLPWTNLWLGTAATNNFKFAPSSTTGARTINIPDFGVSASTTQNFPSTVILTSQYTNSTTGFTNVAGGTTIAFPVAANTNYTATCHLYYQSAATGGLNIEFTGPASPTAVTYGLNSPITVTASIVTVYNAVATAYSTSLGLAVGTAATNLDAVVSFGLVNGVNAGTVNLLAKSSAAAQLQIQSGSFCEVQ